MKQSVLTSILLLTILLMAACQQEEALPTLIDLGVSQTEAVITMEAQATAAVPTLTPTRSAPTLPPTFTPTDEPTLPPVDPASILTATPQGFSKEGTIYYIYNDDAIATVKGDGTASEILLTFGVGSRINGLSASPDGQLLSFVAQAAGSAREVFVASRDASYLQQVSCLGFPDVREPTWMPDGKSLAFFASQFPDGPRDIYLADFAGSNDCPTGNNQRLLVSLGSPDASGMTWNTDATRLFFGNESVFVYDMPTQETYQLTQAGAYGPDRSMIYSSTNNRLYYLKASRESGTGDIGSEFIIVRDPSVRPDRPLGLDGPLLFATSLQFSQNANHVLISTEDGLYVYDTLINSNQRILRGLRSAPDAAFSPNAQRIAYTALDPLTSVEQIFLTDLTATQSDQLTNHPEGTIDNLIWLAD